MSTKWYRLFVLVVSLAGIVSGTGMLLAGRQMRIGFKKEFGFPPPCKTWAEKDAVAAWLKVLSKNSTDPDRTDRARFMAVWFNCAAR